MTRLMNDITSSLRKNRLEHFAKEVCCITDQGLFSTSVGAKKGSLNMLLGESMFLRGDYGWLVIEQTKAY